MSINTTEVVETNHNQKVVTINHIEGEHKRVLSLPEVGNDIDVHGTHYQRDAKENEDETHLQKQGLTFYADMIF